MRSAIRGLSSYAEKIQCVLKSGMPTLIKTVLGIIVHFKSFILFKITQPKSDFNLKSDSK